MKRKEIIGHRMIEFEHKGNSEDQIFFLHGFGYQNKWYDELTDELSKKYEVIVPNMYGLNIFPDQPTTIDQYVDITLELSSKFKRRNQHFVGHSLGATVALLSASKNKEIKDVIAISPMMKINYKHLGFTLKYINKNYEKECIVCNLIICMYTFWAFRRCD